MFLHHLHVDRKLVEPISLSEDTMVSDNLQNPQPMQLDEWELLSQLHPANDMQISDLDILGRCDLDKNHNWHDTTIPLHLQELAIDFIQNNHSDHHLLNHPTLIHQILRHYPQLK